MPFQNNQLSLKPHTLTKTCQSDMATQIFGNVIFNTYPTLAPPPPAAVPVHAPHPAPAHAAPAHAAPAHAAPAHPAPVRERNLRRRARHVHREGLAPINADDNFWIKVATVPTDLQYIILPRCDLWARRVECDQLRRLIKHFAPEVFIRVRTCKPGYIGLFYQHVVAEYGPYYGFQ